MPSNVIATEVQSREQNRQQITLLTHMVLVSKDAVGFLWILAIQAMDASAKRDRKGGREEESVWGLRRKGRKEKGREERGERFSDVIELFRSVLLFFPLRLLKVYSSLHHRSTISSRKVFSFYSQSR